MGIFRSSFDVVRNYFTLLGAKFLWVAEALEEIIASTIFIYGLKQYDLNYWWYRYTND